MTQLKNGVTSPSLKVFLVGASQGPQHPKGGLALVFMHEVRVGLKMWNMASSPWSKRIAGSPKKVKSITLVSDDVRF